MKMKIGELLARHVMIPALDLKQGAQRLAELERLRASQYWPPARLSALRLARLRKLLAHAFETCTFYHQSFDRAGCGSAIASLDDLRRFPLVSKADVKSSQHALISTAFDRKALRSARTGGSTGAALELFFDKRCQEMRNAAAMRSDEWAGRRLGEKVASLWGNPPIALSLKDRLRSALLERILYLDTMAINDESVGVFVERWRRERPTVIFGHAHSIYMLAQFVRDRGIRGIRPRGIISTSMMLLANERRVIEEVFGCQVSNRYGCEEVGLIAAECELHNGLHVNSEHVIVECVDEDGQPVGPGKQGEVVVTDLMNFGMPLVRYRVGDVARWADTPCGCGRGLEVIRDVIGRTADFLLHSDGTLVAGVSLIERTLTKIPGLDQLQIIQEGLEEFVLNVVPGPEWDLAASAALVEELQTVFGHHVAVTVVARGALPVEASGKYRFSKRNIPLPGTLNAGRAAQ